MDWIGQLINLDWIEFLGELLKNTDFNLFVQSDIQQDWKDVSENIKISPVVNEHILELNRELTNKSISWASKLTRLGRALGAIFAIIVAGKEAYKVMAEQRGFDVLAIMRPVLFAIVLAFWKPVVNTVMAPGLAIENSMRGMYIGVETEMEDLRRQRYVKAYEFKEKLLGKQAANKQAESDSSWWKELWKAMTDPGEKMKEIKDDVTNWIKATIVVMETTIFEFIDRLIMWIGETCFTVGAYVVFVTKGLYLCVLTMFGPIWMGASVLPAWKDAWQQWIAKVVHASLYGAMAYLVMSFSMQIIMHNLQIDISTLTALCGGADDMVNVLEYDMGGIGTCISSAICYFVGMIALTAVPDLASCAFPGSASMAAANFIGGMKHQASRGVGMAGGALKPGK